MFTILKFTKEQKSEETRPEWKQFSPLYLFPAAEPVPSSNKSWNSDQFAPHLSTRATERKLQSRSDFDPVHWQTFPIISLLVLFSLTCSVRNGRLVSLKWWTCLSRCCFWSSGDSDFINLALQSRCNKHPKAEKELRTGIPGPDRMKQNVPFIFHPTSVLRHCECDGAERSTSNWRTVTRWINAFKMLC